MWADHFGALGTPSEIVTFDKGFFTEVTDCVRESLSSFLTDPRGVPSEPLEQEEIAHVCSNLKLRVGELLFQPYQTFFNNFSVCDSLLTGVI